MYSDDDEDHFDHTSLLSDKLKNSLQSDNLKKRFHLTSSSSSSSSTNFNKLSSLPINTPHIKSLNDNNNDDNIERLHYTPNQLKGDENLTIKLINSIEQFKEQGNEGDLPFPSSFMTKKNFWQVFISITLVSLLISMISVLYLNILQEIPKKWINCDITIDYKCADLNSGQNYYAIITCLSGLIIGFLYSTFDFPMEIMPNLGEIGFYKALKINPEWLILIFIMIIVSILGGSGLGPELGLLYLGGSIANFILLRLNFPGDGFNQLFRLSSIVCSISTFLPSPFLSTLLIHELAQPPRSFMESTILFSLSSCLSYMLFSFLSPFTSLVPLDTKIIFLTIKWIRKDSRNLYYELIIGIFIGIISSILIIIMLILSKILRKIVKLWYELSEDYSSLSKIIPSLFTGIFLGLFATYTPLILYNGRDLAVYLIKFGVIKNYLSISTLFKTFLAKYFLLILTTSTGWIGGQIYPIFSIAGLLGTLCYKIQEEYYTNGNESILNENKHYYQLNILFYLSCFLSSFASALIPLPFTLTCLVSFTLFLGFNYMIPAYVASLTCYLFTYGLGIGQYLLDNANKNSVYINQKRQEKEQKKLKKKLLEEENNNHNNNNNNNNNDNDNEKNEYVRNYIDENININDDDDDEDIFAVHTNYHKLINEEQDYYDECEL